MKAPGFFALALAGVLVVALPRALPAADLSFRFGTITTEPLEVEQNVQLTGPEVKPTRAAFAVILITADGTLPAEELAAAHKAASLFSDFLKWSAEQKYGADVPIAHELVVTTAGEASAHHERLKHAGYTFINRANVPKLSQPVVFEGFGLKEFAPHEVMGEGVVVVVVEAQPRISRKGSIRLNLKARAGGARVTSSVPGVDRAALDEALERMKGESLQQAEVMLRPSNLRAWVLTARDREAIVSGAVPLKKAVPLSIFGQSVRLKLRIPADLEFTGEVAADPSWDFTL